jgi:site-specific recombinase XerD
MSSALREVLLEEYAERRSSRWVAANRAGIQEHHLLPKLKKICRRGGIEPAAATVHALWHSFGAHLRMASVPLANIADLMGHRDLSTTQIYAKVRWSTCARTCPVSRGSCRFRSRHRKPSLRAIRQQGGS